MKVIVGINTLTDVDNFVYSNHAEMYFQLGRRLDKEDQAILFHPHRMSIDRMRNETCRLALKYDAEYILFIDDDVQIPSDTFFQLRRHDKDIVAGITHIRGYPFHPMAFKYDRDDSKNCYYDDYEDYQDDNGLVECDAVGFSCCLIKTDVIRKMSVPYALTGATHTEDIYFCGKAKQEIPDLKIYVDAKLQTSHRLGCDFIDFKNKPHLQKYLEDSGVAAPEVEEKEHGDHTEEYLKEQGIDLASIESGVRE